MRVLGAWIVAGALIAGNVAGGPTRAGGSAGRGMIATPGRSRGGLMPGLAAAWGAAKVRPVARADDGEFLRRASLDLVGRIPTAAEARDFLDDPNPGKRAALVDRLLDSPAYAARATILWRQLLLPDTGDRRRQPAGGFEAWLTRKVDEGAGYDRVVREILGAKLAGRERRPMADAALEPSPAAYYAAKGGKPEVLAADSARAFLGIRLECAQCHNHPFAKWKREEFWGYAAFFAGVPQQADPNDPAAVGVPPPARTAPPPRADHPRDGHGRSRPPTSTAPPPSGAPGPTPARSWPTGSPPRQPVLRPRRRQPDLGPLLRQRPDRPGRRPRRRRRARPRRPPRRGRQRSSATTLTT